MKNSSRELYINLACENEKIYDNSTEGSDYKEESGYNSDGGESDEGGQDGENGEDSDIEEYVQNLSECDDQFEEILKKKKVYAFKSNPGNDELNGP